MKKSTLTENKAENTPTGGVLVGKRDGQTIIHNKGTLSGYLVGRTHDEGGIKAVNKSTGQALEMQGGEVVITAPAVSDNTKHEFDGEMLTNRQILSKINVKGGGVAFAKDGMEIPKSIKSSGKKYNYGGKMMTDKEILSHINGGNLSKGKSLSQIAKMHKVTLKELQKQVDMGMKAESEHTKNKKEQLKIVKDHLVENPKYYTLLKKAGLSRGSKLFDANPFLNYYFDDVASFLANQNDIVLRKDWTFKYKGEEFVIEPFIVHKQKKVTQVTFSIFDYENEEVGEIFFMADAKDKHFTANSNFFQWSKRKFKGGGAVKESLVRDAKTGNTPARDFNNYNDIVDVGADGEVGGDAGLFILGGQLNSHILSWSDVPADLLKFNTPKAIPFINSPSSDGLYSIVKKFLGTDDLRPNLKGIKFDDNGISVTNSHILITIPQPNPNYSGVYIPQVKRSEVTGVVKENVSYPIIRNAIPENSKCFFYNFSIKKLYTYLRVAENYAGEGQFSRMGVKINGGIDDFDIKLMINVLESMIKIGFPDDCFVGTQGSAKPLVFTTKNDYEFGKDTILMLMPLINMSKSLGVDNSDNNSSFGVYFSFDDNHIHDANGDIVDLNLSATKPKTTRKPRAKATAPVKKNEIFKFEEISSKSWVYRPSEIKTALVKIIHNQNVATFKAIGFAEEEYKNFNLNFGYKDNGILGFIDVNNFTDESLMVAFMLDPDFDKYDFQPFFELHNTEYQDLLKKAKDIIDLKLNTNPALTLEQKWDAVFNEIQKILDDNKVVTITTHGVYGKTTMTEDFIIQNLNPETLVPIELRVWTNAVSGLSKEDNEVLKKFKSWKDHHPFASQTNTQSNAPAPAPKIVAWKLLHIYNGTKAVSSEYYARELAESLRLAYNHANYPSPATFILIDSDGNEHDNFVFDFGVKDNGVLGFINVSNITDESLLVALMQNPHFNKYDWQGFFEKNDADWQSLVTKAMYKSGMTGTVTNPAPVKPIIDNIFLSEIDDSGLLTPTASLFDIAELKAYILEDFKDSGKLKNKFIIRDNYEKYQSFYLNWIDRKPNTYLAGLIDINNLDNIDFIIQLKVRLGATFDDYNWQKFFLYDDKIIWDAIIYQADKIIDDEGLALADSTSTQPTAPAQSTEQDDVLKKILADTSKLIYDSDIMDSLVKDKKDLFSLTRLLPSFQGSKFSTERAMLLKEMNRIHKKITYEGFIKQNEEYAKDNSLFTPQGLLDYYYTQSTQSPVTKLGEACGLPTPNGGQSKLPFDAYMNVRTQQFKDWFGDWEMAYETGNYVNCSKMIDEDTKEPRVYFHGVRKYVPSFGQMSNMGSGVVRPYGAFEPPSTYPASFFAEQLEYAEFYGGIAPNMPTPSPDYKPFIYNVFLSVKNPVSLLPLGFEASYKDLLDYLTIAYGVKVSPNQELVRVLGDIKKVHPIWVYIRRDIGLLETLKEYGYDSLIQEGDIPTFDDNGQVVEDRSKFIREKEFLVFKASQVKSATVKKSFYFDFFNDVRFKKGGYVSI